MSVAIVIKTDSRGTLAPCSRLHDTLLFLLLVALLGDVILLFGILYRQYANDTQLYITIDHETAGSESTNLGACTAAVYEWLLHYCLALNPDKSDSAIFDTVARTKSLRIVVSVNVAGTPITLSHCIKSLGVIVDKNLKFYAYISGSVRVVSSISEPSAI